MREYQLILVKLHRSNYFSDKTWLLVQFECVTNRVRYENTGITMCSKGTKEPTIRVPLQHGFDGGGGGGRSQFSGPGEVP